MRYSNSSSLRIAIIENDPIMQLGLKQALSHHPKFEIIAQTEDDYSSIKSALDLKPDLAIADISATQQIKANYPEIRVVILTSHTADREVLLALANGADAYCIKGSHVSQIVDAIAAVQSGAMYLDKKVRHVVNQLKDAPINRSRLNLNDLNDREMDVLKLLVEGCSNGRIAETLFLSESTVKIYLRGIMTKFEAKDRVQVVVTALRSGLVQ